MPGKTPRSYDLDEVCLFLTAIGLESKVDIFRENAVDGDMLVSLEPKDFEELGLSGLQSKKVVRSVEFCNSLADESGGGGGADPAAMAALQKEIAELQNENAALRAQLKEYSPAPAPAPRPAPAPAPAAAPPPKPKPAGAPVVRGAAGGAAKGSYDMSSVISFAW